MLLRVLMVLPHYIFSSVLCLGIVKDVNILAVRVSKIEAQCVWLYGMAEPALGTTEDVCAHQSFTPLKYFPAKGYVSSSFKMNGVSLAYSPMEN